MQLLSYHVQCLHTQGISLDMTEKGISSFPIVHLAALLHFTFRIASAHLGRTMSLAYSISASKSTLAHAQTLLMDFRAIIEAILAQ